MAKGQAPKQQALEREARRLERLCKLRLVGNPPPQKVSTPPFDPPKEAA
jgi:hypothetical protein